MVAVALPAGPAPATSTSTCRGISVKPPPSQQGRADCQRGREEVHSVVVQPRESRPSYCRAPAPMNSPFAGLIAPGTMEAALEKAADEGVRHHPEETYQCSRRDEQRRAGHEGAGAGDDYRAKYRAG